MSSPRDKQNISTVSKLENVLVLEKVACTSSSPGLIGQNCDRQPHTPSYYNKLHENVPPHTVKSLLEDCPAMIIGSNLGIVLRYDGEKLRTCQLYLLKTIFTSGSTLTITMREEMEPVLYIKCLFSQETISIAEKIRVPLLTVYDLRSMVTRKTGLPIGESFLNENVLVANVLPNPEVSGYTLAAMFRPNNTWVHFVIIVSHTKLYHRFIRT